MVEDKIFPCKAGDAFAVNNRELHLLVSSPEMISRWTFLNLDPAGLMAGYAPSTEDVFETESLSGPEFKNVISSEKFPDICNIIFRIAEEMTEKKKSYRSAIRALVWELMVMLHRIAPLKPLPPDTAKYKNIERIKPALKYIASKYSSLVEIPKLSSISNCSITNFRRIFKSAMGISPQEYLLCFRMEIAKTLLKNSMLSILEISLKSGYHTLSNFNRHFKTINGISPREWRRKNKAF
ncbi:MAG: hypothetical protein A2017_22170 [Lentisphaerae bacterium GWF2_44_16]|nr:MAG: hypothetical protein A2017_22170 [Lentisphaerae bacterium GWF2_44_16]